MATIAEPALPMTAHLPRSLKAELEALARTTGRSRDELVQQALRTFIDLQRWQIEEIESGIREADAGIFVSDEEMEELWMELGLEREHRVGRSG
jgi:RHH-type transcriptional regulator, rel operon repressor / antitoxin RelB